MSYFTRPEKPANQPTIVVLCGSTRFSHAFREANLRETLPDDCSLEASSVSAQAEAGQ